MNAGNFDLNLLRVFDALMATRSVSLAAVRLGLTQPSVSNALARLRAQCGDPMFVRTNEGMQPTAFAQELAEPMAQALALVMRALQTSNRFDPATDARRFTLVLSDIGAAIFVPVIMKAVARNAPGVDVRVLQLPRDEIAPALETGAADLALGRLGDALPDFRAQRLLTSEYVCVMRKEHPLARRRRLTLDDYERALHVAPAPPSYGEAQIDRVVAQRRIRRRVQLQVAHYLVIPAILLETDLIATIPDRLLGFLANPADFRIHRLPIPVGRLEIHQFWHPRFHRDAGNRWLRSVFASHFLKAR